MAVITMKQLLESGVHFGHQTRRWNPKMDRYIYTSRNGIHIIDLQQTVVKVEEAYKDFLEIAKNGGKVLFVGTKKQAVDTIVNEATRANHFYVSKRWLGGTLTNFKTIRKSIRRLHQIKQMEKDGTFDRLPKKEVIGLNKELDRLETFLGGIQEMRTLPEAIFVVDPKKDHNAVLEARKLKIPVYGMVDTNCDPDEIDFIIPANDDAIRSIKVITKTLADALIEGTSAEAAETEESTEAKPAPQKAEKPAPKAQAKPAPKKVDKPTPKKAEAPKAKPAPQKAEKPTPKPEAKPAPKQAEVSKKPTREEELNEKTVAELRAVAKERGLTGYSKMKKAELVDALK